MKFFTALLTIALAASLCTTSKYGSYSDKADNSSPTLEIAGASSYHLDDNNLIQPVTPLSFQETNSIALSEEYQAKASTVDEPVLIALAPQENTENGNEPALPITILMANSLRESATAIDSRFAKRMLIKSANRVEKMSFESARRPTLMNKIRAKVSEKFFAAYTAPPGDGGVLAIISLITGILAFAWYASFVLGVVAIVTGAIALAKGTSRRGMAIAGIVLGAIAIALWAGILGGGVL